MSLVKRLIFMRVIPYSLLKGRVKNMGKSLSSKISALLALVLVLQVFLFPMKNVLGATDNNLLPPSNLAYQHITPDDVKLEWH